MPACLNPTTSSIRGAWRDEHLKRTCGFADADGGAICIGMSDDGEAHCRSGATRQQLEGAALTRFLSDRMGFSREGAGIPGVGPDDLWQGSSSTFRDEALVGHRMGEGGLSGTKAGLLDRLQLVGRGNVTRAGILLFSRHPEWHAAPCHTRIGRFVSDADIAYRPGLLPRGPHRVVGPRHR